jgi:hypothetical protein
MQEASDAKRGGLPKSLRERLALLECGVLPVPASKARVGARQQAGHRARPLVGTSFWLGLGLGSALGSAMLLLALFSHPEQTQARLRQVLALADAISRPAPLPSASRPGPGPVQADAPTQAAFEMSIRRGDGGAAPLALRISGVDRPENVQVLLRNVPATARLSRGERRDEGTWALRLVELENLHLMLGDGTPDTFDMMVEVASARGMQMAKAVAHVRVSEQGEVAQTSAPPLPAVAASVDRARQQALPVASGSSVIEKPFRTEVTALAQSGELAPGQRSTPRPPLPEGMSTLGGPTGGAASPSTMPQESRVVWWKLPPPAWSPFANGSSGP